MQTPLPQSFIPASMTPHVQRFRENLKLSVQQSLSFFSGMAVGIAVDQLVRYLSESWLVDLAPISRVTREPVAKVGVRFPTLVLMALLQIWVNVIVVSIFKFYELAGDYFTMGMFLPQSLVMKKVYKSALDRYTWL